MSPTPDTRPGPVAPAPAPAPLPAPGPFAPVPTPLPDPQVVTQSTMVQYAVIGTLMTVCAAFDAALANRTIVLPPAWAWVTVIIQPLLVFWTTALAKVIDTPWSGSAKETANYHRALHTIAMIMAMRQQEDGAGRASPPDGGGVSA